MKNNDITLIITNWNGADLLTECLPSVLKAVAFDKARTYEVLVIDDCSSDNSLDLLANQFPTVRRERTKKSGLSGSQ
jgi:glycosyltransferase involved in cell wall biosynthesis